MLANILWFEIRYWLRSWMLWIFFLVIGLLIFGAVSSEHVVVGDSLGNTFHNAPFVIQNFYSIVGFFTLLMTTAFVNSAAARDFSFNTHQILFSTPLRRFDFLLGRFIGAACVSVIPMLGVSAAILLAKYMPWVDPEHWGPVVWKAHLYGILVFAIPNTLLMAAILFAIAILARNEIVSFVAGLLLLVGYAATDGLLQNVDRAKLAALIDPFGIRAFSYFTKYWTVAEKNTVSLGLSGIMLGNRLLWLAVAAAVFLFAYWRFSFAERRKPSKPESVAHGGKAPATQPLPAFAFHDAPLAKFLDSVNIHFWGTIKSTVFIVVILAALLNCVPALAFNASQGYGNATFPVTYWVLELIASTFYAFLVALITYYAGVLVWKDRDNRTDEITDALPFPEWISYAARLTALAGIVFIVLAIVMVSGIIVQAALGYHRYQIDLYLKELFIRDGSLFLFLSVLAFLIHVLAPNKYAGYFGYVAFLVANFFIWRPLNVVTHLVRFGSRPRVVYSDFFADRPFRQAWDWYSLYWVLFCALLIFSSIMLWPRGKQANWRDRLGNARLRFTAVWRWSAGLCLLASAAVGGWIYYNTKILNTYTPPNGALRLQADYEKQYKRFANVPMPRLRGVKYNIQIFPESRNLIMTGDAVIENPYSHPVDEIHFTLNREYQTAIEIPGATLVKDDKRIYYQIFRFSPPMPAGDRRTVHFTVKTDTRGFENEVSDLSVVQDGTFFNNAIGPIIGYTPNNELTDPRDRKKYGLGEQQLMLPLERDCTSDCMETYIGGHTDWADMQTIISTSGDQIAVAPGSLVREWKEDGRNYFEYKLDHPSLGFAEFISARYQVAREDWNGVKVEVYYIKDHPWNVPRMLKSIERSLEYCTTNFGPYYHKEARIIEFPRVAMFAQAFPGTMPYSESIGFIANLEKPDDIDMVYYVVAHEMAHQWWAHQVIGANMQGGTLLSETMAQYTALMVMEKEYGRDIMRKFLRYEMDRYLSSRGRERLKERPLLTVEAQQGYIHYRKGSVALYYLKEMIGEDAVNRALRRIVARYAYAPPPYPTSWVLIDELKKETPTDKQYLIQDLFEDITIFSNRTLEASAERRADGNYDVTLKIEAHKYKADDKGREAEVPVDDWIEIGAFAKPGKGKQYGDTLYRQRIHLTSAKSTETFIVDRQPDRAGVDPFNLLIDRVPDDNVKKVNIVSTRASTH
jgi:ABC-type transport system involved in multi-copper enzyme maturation permease subunit